MISEKHVEIAAKMYDARRVLKSLCPNKFAPHCKEWQDVIRKVSAGKGISEMEALVDILGKLKDSAMSQMWVLASYVEMVEPSEGI